MTLLYAYLEEPTHCPEWWRVIHNIVENTTIDSAKTFVSAIKSFTELTKGANQGHATFQTALGASGFAKDQRMEERKKLELIAANPSWRGRIVEAERLPWQKGRIGFLLDQGDSDPETFATIKGSFMSTFADETSRRAWLRDTVLPRIEAAYYTPDTDKAVYIPCTLVYPENDHILKDFLYSHSWQIESLAQAGQATTARSAWRDRLDCLCEGWDDPRGQPYADRYVIQTRSVNSPGVYLYTRRYLNDNTAYRIDKAVDWWYALSGVTPCNNRWCLIRGGTAVEVTWQGETLRLIHVDPGWQGVCSKDTEKQTWGEDVAFNPQTQTLGDVVKTLREEASHGNG